jgi:conjugal transfer pilus assembly protein TraD
MLARQYEMPWRRATEVYAAAAWVIATAFFGVAVATGHLPAALALPLAMVCLGMGALRANQARHVLVLRASGSR